jgi:hypothetical protein
MAQRLYPPGVIFHWRNTGLHPKSDFLAPVWIHSSMTLFPLVESPPQRPRRKPKRAKPGSEAFLASVMAHFFCYTRPIWRKYPVTMPDIKKQARFIRLPCFEADLFGAI